jgi:hypothetical protein
MLWNQDITQSILNHFSSDGDVNKFVNFVLPRRANSVEDLKKLSNIKLKAFKLLEQLNGN